MKKLIIPTDFSPSSEKALDYAARMAKVTGASLLIINVYQMPVSMGDMPVMMISAEELKKNADSALEEFKSIIVKKHPELQVQTDSRMGDVVDEVNEVCTGENVLAVVVGTKPYKGIEKILFGNTTLSIIRHCPAPVISVPSDARIASPKNLVLATDLENIEQIPAGVITEIVQLLQATLHVVHIRENETPPTDAEQQLLQKLQQANPVFETVTDEDVIHGLQQYVEQNNIDLLIALPHKHNLYERLFFKLHTEGLIEKMPVPVMCLQNQ